MNIEEIKRNIKLGGNLETNIAEVVKQAEIEQNRADIEVFKAYIDSNKKKWEDFDKSDRTKWGQDYCDWIDTKTQNYNRALEDLKIFLDDALKECNELYLKELNSPTQ